MDFSVSATKFFSFTNWLYGLLRYISSTACRLFHVLSEWDDTHTAWSPSLSPCFQNLIYWFIVHFCGSVWNFAVLWLFHYYGFIILVESCLRCFSWSWSSVNFRWPLVVMLVQVHIFVLMVKVSLDLMALIFPLGTVATGYPLGLLLAWFVAFNNKALHFAFFILRSIQVSCILAVCRSVEKIGLL